jgi:hypothetical protein
MGCKEEAVAGGSSSSPARRPVQSTPSSIFRLDRLAVRPGLRGRSRLIVRRLTRWWCRFLQRLHRKRGSRLVVEDHSRITRLISHRACAVGWSGLLRGRNVIEPDATHPRRWQMSLRHCRLRILRLRTHLCLEPRGERRQGRQHECVQTTGHWNSRDVKATSLHSHHGNCRMADIGALRVNKSYSMR